MEMENTPKVEADVREPSHPVPTEMVDELPPFLGQWSRIYVAVLCYLAVLITVLYAVSRFFNYQPG